MNNKDPTVAVVTLTLSNSGFIPLTNLIKVLIPLSKELHVLTGSIPPNFFEKSFNIYFHETNHKPGKNFLSRAFYNFYSQLVYSWNIIKLLNKVDTFIFFIGADLLIIPLFILKIFRKKTFLFFAGDPIKSSRAKKDKMVFIQSILSKISCKLSDKIIVYSDNMISEGGLTTYSDKIIVTNIHFLDFKKFKITKEYKNRKQCVGFVGRLSEEKGIINFMDALIEISKNNNIKFIIIGEGPLEKEIKNKINNHNLNEHVHLVGWIPHEELPRYLNEIKLLVLPSYTEGLPKIILESMACGTPVLSTSVGAISDIVRDERNGFIMENNAASSITKNSKRALEHPKIDMVIENAQSFVKAEFNYNMVVTRWEKIFK